MATEIYSSAHAPSDLRQLVPEVVDSLRGRPSEFARLLRWAPGFDVHPLDWYGASVESEESRIAREVLLRAESEGVFEVHWTERESGRVHERIAKLWWDRGVLQAVERRLDLLDPDPCQVRLREWFDAVDPAVPECRISPERPVVRTAGALRFALPELWTPVAPVPRGGASDFARVDFALSDTTGKTAARLCTWTGNLSASSGLELAIEALRRDGFDVSGGPAMPTTNVGHARRATWFLSRVTLERTPLDSAVVHLDLGPDTLCLWSLHPPRARDVRAWAAGRRAFERAVRTADLRAD